ncbi:MAG TPA: hypothetical protein VMA53_16635 [Stellaceae bacterium]|nr:hypothetical protein [Stellaceae bacterium]
MTPLGRSTTIGFLVFLVLAATTTAWAQTRPPIAEQIAKTYGLASFGKIEAIRYTFNAQLPGVKLSRSWVWHPKTDQVSFEGKDKDGKPVKATYIRSQLNDAPANVADVIDPDFVNDQYWLLLPFHVYWDDSADVRDMGMQKLPSGKGSAQQVVMKYPAEGGYSSGDTWELYLGPDHRIVEMVYRRGGPKKPQLVITSWAGYKKAGPLLISTEHSGTADGKPLHLSFSNVAVKLEGSDKWVPAR